MVLARRKSNEKTICFSCSLDKRTVASRQARGFLVPVEPFRSVWPAGLPCECRPRSQSAHNRKPDTRRRFLWLPWLGSPEFRRIGRAGEGGGAEEAHRTWFTLFSGAAEICKAASTPTTDRRAKPQVIAQRLDAPDEMSRFVLRARLARPSYALVLRASG